MKLYSVKMTNSGEECVCLGLHIALKNLPPETQTIEHNLNEIWAFDERNRPLAVIKEVE